MTIDAAKLRERIENYRQFARDLLNHPDLSDDECRMIQDYCRDIINARYVLNHPELFETNEHIKL